MTAPSDLARRLVEHPRWTWQPGMVTTHRHDVVTHDRLVTAGRFAYGLPDLEHPATKGWLLHMLREATPTAWCVRGITRTDRWYVYAHNGLGPYCVCEAPTEGEALAAALLAVWGVGDVAGFTEEHEHG